MAPVTPPGRPLLVITRCASAHPLHGVPVAGSHLFREPPSGQEPDDLPVAARNRLFGRAIASLEIVKRKMGLNRKSCGHTPIIHKDLV
jgi:hypothetical protein